MPGYTPPVSLDALLTTAIFNARLSEDRAKLIDALPGLLTKASFDDVVGDPTSPTIEATIAGLLNALGFSFDERGELTMDGTEKDAVKWEEADLETYEAPFYGEGYIDLSTMQAGDTIVVKEYASVITPVSYKIYATHTYTGVQSEPLVHFTKKTGAYGWKVTAQQTAGTNRTLKIAFFRRRVK